ncbi:MAG: 4Fe-4S dicluster domain-containing protein [Bacillota bacterium]
MSPARKTWKVLVDPAWCKACSICIAFCPRQVLEADESGKALVARPEDCSGCRLCELRCPDFAITVSEEKEDEDG